MMGCRHLCIEVFHLSAGESGASETSGRIAATARARVEVVEDFDGLHCWIAEEHNRE